jgi:hypothetical protein
MGDGADCAFMLAAIISAVIIPRSRLVVISTSILVGLLRVGI